MAGLWSYVGEVRVVRVPLAGSSVIHHRRVGAAISSGGWRVLHLDAVLARFESDEVDEMLVLLNLHAVPRAQLHLLAARAANPGRRHPSAAPGQQHVCKRLHATSELRKSELAGVRTLRRGDVEDPCPQVEVDGDQALQSQINLKE